MILWMEWMKLAVELRSACSRRRGFFWLLVALIGFSIRSDLLGASSFMRALGLTRVCYDRLLDFFHSNGINPDTLAQKWTTLVLRHFPSVLRVNGRIIVVGDGIKNGKSGRKMPGVKLLHQESDNNTKPEYIMGHSCQAVALIVEAENGALAVPLAARIHEGVVFSNRCKKRLPAKMVSLVRLLGITDPYYFLGDAYYACHHVICGVTDNNGHCLSRVRINAVACHPASTPQKRGRGRPKVYGTKIKLASLFDNLKLMTEAQSPVYGESQVVIRYRCVDLLWKPAGRVIRFVAVDHPVRGRILLMTTDLSLVAIELIRLYGLRFKIEVSFKQELRIIGAYGYHFWMMGMKKIRRCSGNQYLHCESDVYRNAVRRKVAAYHRFIQIGLIAQGLIQYLSSTFPKLVWKSFGSWLCTIRPGVPPSEMVTANALRSTFPEFLMGNNNASTFTKFLLDRIDLNRSEGLRLTG
ncbi:MAG: hypothetical protein ACD_62C00090G0007 [uncultured bacterium]|nr:MAG: hypothetical protein ACD_62C00090G0007 [uncultured bacterium]